MYQGCWPNYMRKKLEKAILGVIHARPVPTKRNAADNRQAQPNMAHYPKYYRRASTLTSTCAARDTESDTLHASEVAPARTIQFVESLTVQMIILYKYKSSPDVCQIKM